MKSRRAPQSRRSIPLQTSRAFRQAGRTLPTPSELMPEQSAFDRRLASEVERDSEIERHAVFPDKVRDADLPGVPLAEELDTAPDKIADYCAREPFLLTDNLSLDKTPKFGIVDARFKALAAPWQEKKQLIEDMRIRLKDGDVPASYELRARRDEDFARLVLRFLGGDSLTDEYNKAAAKAEEYRAAAAIASNIYHQQMKKTFRLLEASMSRREIGAYAQNMWTRNFLQLEQEGGFQRRYFRAEVAEKGDGVLKEFATASAAQALKWIALNINEIPLGREPARGSLPRPVIN